MSRCQHCMKLTHPEDLIVEYDLEQHQLVSELSMLENWSSPYLYHPRDPHLVPSEYGKLKCGDIYIHFRMKTK